MLTLVARDGKGGNLPVLSPLRLIAYERVSTARQGQSGLGLEAQRKTIDAFAASRGAAVLARFTEVESGRNPDRPELGKAIQLARLTGATLVIAKLDRLSRNAAFLLTLRDSGVRFLACDMPEANDLTAGIMALVAQQEREAISRRTKEALAVAKARGVRLGIRMAPQRSGGRATMAEPFGAPSPQMRMPSLATFLPSWIASAPAATARFAPSPRS